MMMRTLLIVATVIGLSASALAQTEAPKAAKSPRQIKPQAQMGCKLVGTVRGISFGRATVRPRQNFAAQPLQKNLKRIPPPPRSNRLAQSNGALDWRRASRRR
jgi:hypothetical protein